MLRQMPRVNQVDALKAGAIASVLLLHALPREALVSSWAVLHIWQAVPIFMVLMGFVAQWGAVYRRLIRLLVPFAVLWLVSLVIGVVLDRLSIGWLSLAGYLPVTGPGNYFVPVALCICLLLPFLRYLAKLSPLLLLVVTALVDLAFELAAPHIWLFADHVYLYSAAFPRYLLCVGFGFWLAAKPRLRWVAIVGLGSVVYLVGSQQFGWQPPFLPNWGSQNLLAAGYPALLVALAVSYLPKTIPSLLTTLGRASYHVFLVQILFFVVAGSLPTVWKLLLVLVACPLLGVLWFEVENGVRRRLRALPASAADEPVFPGPVSGKTASKDSSTDC